MSNQKSHQPAGEYRLATCLQVQYSLIIAWLFFSGTMETEFGQQQFSDRDHLQVCGLVHEPIMTSIATS